MKYIAPVALLMVSLIPLISFKLLSAQEQDKAFAQVALYPNIATVTLDKNVKADQIIVTVFYRDTVTIAGTELLRSMTDVQPALSGVGVAIRSVLDPSTVKFVRVETVRNVGRMEWRPGGQ